MGGLRKSWELAGCGTATLTFLQVGVSQSTLERNLRVGFVLHSNLQKQQVVFANLQSDIILVGHVTIHVIRSPNDYS